MCCIRYVVFVFASFILLSTPALSSQATIRMGNICGAGSGLIPNGIYEDKYGNMLAIKNPSSRDEAERKGGGRYASVTLSGEAEPILTMALTIGNGQAIHSLIDLEKKDVEGLPIPIATIVGGIYENKLILILVETTEHYYASRSYSDYQNYRLISRYHIWELKSCL